MVVQNALRGKIHVNRESSKIVLKRDGDERKQ